MNRKCNPNNSRSRSRSRKRSWAVVGLWLLPVVVRTTTTASPFLQPHIPPARRRVLYASSSSSTAFVHPKQQQQQTELKPSQTKQYTSEDYQTGGETIWFVHADAERDHPDRVFAQIRNNPHCHSAAGCLQPETSLFPTKKNLPFSSWMTSTSSLWSWRGWKNGNTILRRRRRRIQTDETSPQGAEETNDNENSTRSDSIGFNVTVDTEYNVTETVVLESNSTTNDTSTVVFTNNEQNNHTNASSSSSQQQAPPEQREFRPIRIRAFLSELAGGGQYLNETERVIVLQSILRPALLAWSAALRVEPVIGNLTVDPEQLVNGIACGPGGSLPSVVVPESHITTGVPDTDFVLYISLAFTNAPAQKNKTRTPQENDEFDDDDKDEEQEEDSNFGFGVFTQKDNNTTSQTMEDLQTKQKCSGDYLAASAFCSTDQLDRPTAGILHLCITKDFFHPVNLQTNIMLTMHELGHALGFNSVSLAHFRRWDGTPITPRDPETGEIPLVEIECTGPVGQRRRGTVALPSEEILQFRTVRGGVRVAEVVTPSVRQVARNHFDCQNLTGAELESGEFLPLSTNPGETSCIGDHWERRLFRSDIMNPIVDDTTVFSPFLSTITLAYFADSGFYQVDLTRASMAAWWGRAAGCAFVDETCIRPLDGQVPPAYDSLFCNQAPQQTNELGFVSELHGCTPDLSRKASCTLGSWEGELPTAYQYFNVTFGADVGGNDPFMDFCPVYAGFRNGLCSDPANEAFIKVNYVERIGRRNSRCLTASIAQNFAAPSSAPTVAPTETEDTALCLPIACVVEDRSLQIQVNGVWEVCNKTGDVIIGSAQNGMNSGNILSIVCPDPIRICPTFYCRRDCLGTNRICDYNIGECVCNMTSPYAANDTILEWNNTDSFSDAHEYPDELCSTNSSDPNFFHPDGDDDGKLPSPESPLADYYVPRRRDLQEENGGFWSNPWKTGTVAGSAAVLCIFIAYLLFHALKRTLVGSSNNNDDDNNLQPINPEKHKMIASVLVDMRMRDPNLQQRIDALGNRNSETDLSMTETEASADAQNTTRDSEVVCELELSTYGEGGISNLFGGGHSDNNTNLHRMSSTGDHKEYIDPLAPPVCTTPIVRRRHILYHNR